MPYLGLQFFRRLLLASRIHTQPGITVLATDAAAHITKCTTHTAPLASLLTAFCREAENSAQCLHYCYHTLCHSIAATFPHLHPPQVFHPLPSLDPRLPCAWPCNGHEPKEHQSSAPNGLDKHQVNVLANGFHTMDLHLHRPISAHATTECAAFEQMLQRCVWCCLSNLAQRCPHGRVREHRWSHGSLHACQLTRVRERVQHPALNLALHACQLTQADCQECVSVCSTVHPALNLALHGLRCWTT